MVSDIKCLLHWRFCFESLTFISSFPKKSVRCREISAIKFVLYKEVSLYFDSLKPEILFAVDEIRLKKNTIILRKQQDLNKSAIETTVIELPKLNVIENKKKMSQCFDSFYQVNSSSDETKSLNTITRFFAKWNCLSHLIHVS